MRIGMRICNVISMPVNQINMGVTWCNCRENWAKNCMAGFAASHTEMMHPAIHPGALSERLRKMWWGMVGLIVSMPLSPGIAI